MEEITLTGQSISAFREFLVENEKARATVEKYVQEAEQLRLALCGAPVTKAGVLAYRERLQQQYRALTVNNKLSAVNAYLRFCGAEHCEVKLLKVQRRAFREEQRDLTESEYRRLLSIAKGRKNQRLYHVMLTICATGIRVSEVRYVTVEAVYRGRAEISLKGKIRTILLPGKLCRKLLKYARKQKIASGEIFLTRNEKGISRRQIWAEMKALCDKAGVAPSKVFPHNLRHLFARTFYRVCRDVAKLADVLGHSSIETTRIYLISTGAQHRRDLDRLRLVC